MIRRLIIVTSLLSALPACKTTDDVSPVASAPVVQPTAPTVPAAPEPPAAGRTVNGFTISEFEYWPFRWKDAEGACPYPYPAGVRYGFGAGGAAARECMRKAYQSLWAILHAPPASLVKLRDAGGPKTFYLWINDYTEAKVDAAGEPVPECQPDPSLRSVWHFNPPRGLIKWVNEVMKDGSCKLRTSADLEAFAAEALVVLDRP